VSRAAVFVDTSALYALFAPSDGNHKRAKATLAHLRGERVSLLTSSAVLAESYVFVHARTGQRGLLRFRHGVGGSSWLRSVGVSRAWDEAAWQLLARQQDKDYSYVDATSFVLMRALEITRAFSFDEHFRQAGFEMLPGGR